MEYDRRNERFFASNNKEKIILDKCMIPKLIHCVWLSGDCKPEMYKKCIASWEETMPDYDIKEWSLENLPKGVLNHSFVSSAIKARKWAYATDFIRLWALYNYGGIYMDMDVIVYKPFDVFLKHSAFSCIEFNPRNFYKNIKNGKIKDRIIYGLNIEAAVIGSVKHHIWIKDMIDYYNNIDFIANKKYYQKILMPLIISRVSLKYGFKYIPIYQVLDNDIHLYPPDVFSSCYDTSIMKCSSVCDYRENQIRYSYHLCAHSWYEDLRENTILYHIKKFFIGLFGQSFCHKIKRIINRGISV